LWRRVAEYCVEHQIKLPTLKRVLMSGAPVPPQVHENLLHRILPTGAETHAPYGATESLPACDLPGSAVLAETAAATASGQGYCVGAAVAGVELKIIDYVDDVLADFGAVKILPGGAVGEIIVSGENVTRAYHQLPLATARAKIYDGAKVWHRLGDLGYLDAQARVWFCGRAAHRVTTATGFLYSVCCEAIFNAHPQVRRSALVGLGAAPHQLPLLVLETTTRLTGAARKKLVGELLALGSANACTREITQLEFCAALPVDIRHNAKIDREKLRAKFAPKIGRISR
jgi:acyl-CoA synthetase (AMP-forming)/AMP-acid ligase II